MEEICHFRVNNKDYDLRKLFMANNIKVGGSNVYSIYPKSLVDIATIAPGATPANAVTVAVQTILENITIQNVGGGVPILLGKNYDGTGLVFRTISGINGLSVTNDDNNIYISGNSSTTINPTPPPQPNSNVVVITSGSTYNCTGLERYIIVRKAILSPTRIILPLTPVTGSILSIKDSNGSAMQYNITVFTQSNLIDSNTSIFLDQVHQSVTLVYDGTNWNLI
jgi:hypothetical protein